MNANKTIIAKKINFSSCNDDICDTMHKILNYKLYSNNDIYISIFMNKNKPNVDYDIIIYNAVISHINNNYLYENNFVTYIKEVDEYIQHINTYIYMLYRRLHDVKYLSISNLFTNNSMVYKEIFLAGLQISKKENLELFRQLENYVIYIINTKTINSLTTVLLISNLSNLLIDYYENDMQYIKIKNICNYTKRLKDNSFSKLSSLLCAECCSTVLTSVVDTINDNDDEDILLDCFNSLNIISTFIKFTTYYDTLYDVCIKYIYNLKRTLRSLNLIDITNLDDIKSTAFYKISKFFNIISIFLSFDIKLEMINLIINSIDFVLTNKHLIYYIKNLHLLTQYLNITVDDVNTILENYYNIFVVIDNTKDLNEFLLLYLQELKQKYIDIYFNNYNKDKLYNLYLLDTKVLNLCYCQIIKMFDVYCNYKQVLQDIHKSLVCDNGTLYTFNWINPLICESIYVDYCPELLPYIENSTKKYNELYSTDCKSIKFLNFKSQVTLNYEDKLYTLSLYEANILLRFNKKDKIQLSSNEIVNINSLINYNLIKKINNSNIFILNKNVFI